MHITVDENIIATYKIRNNYVAIVGRAITIWEAILKRSNEPIYKTKAKIEAKRLRERQLLLSQNWKSDN